MARVVSAVYWCRQQTSGGVDQLVGVVRRVSVASVSSTSVRCLVALDPVDVGESTFPVVRRPSSTLLAVGLEVRPSLTVRSLHPRQPGPLPASPATVVASSSPPSPDPLHSGVVRPAAEAAVAARSRRQLRRTLTPDPRHLGRRTPVVVVGGRLTRVRGVIPAPARLGNVRPFVRQCSAPPAERLETCFRRPSSDSRRRPPQAATSSGELRAPSPRPDVDSSSGRRVY